MSAAPASPALTAALRAARPELNARYAHARRRMPGLDGEVFGGFVVDALGPVIDAVTVVAPDRAGEIAYALYDVALELCGLRFAGAGAREARVGREWSRLLAAAPRFLLGDPARTAVATANALVQLATTPGARPEAWTAGMARMAGLAADLPGWLAAGQVLAWRAGLAHYREGALALLARMPAPLAVSVLELPAGAELTAVLAQLARDPWFDPAGAGAGLRVVARVGSFRGFGGLFAVPPRVAGGRQLVVSSGDEAWILCADAFGATFHRAGPDEVRAAAAELPAGLRVSGQSLSHGAHTVKMPLRGGVTSAAAVGATLALTAADTHAVVLVALPR